MAPSPVSEDDGVYGVFNPTGEVEPPPGFRAVLERPGLVLLERPGCRGGTLSRRGDSAIHLFGEIYNVQDVWPASDGSGDDMVSLHELLAAPDWLERLPRLNGSFHITAYDGQASRLRLIPDRYGTRKCYYGWRDGRLCFFPHLQDLLPFGFRARIEQDLLLEFLTFRWIFDGRTFVEDAFVLPYATVVEASRDGLTRRRYWTPRFDESRDDLDDPEGEVRELGERLLRATERAVSGKGRLLVPLSGGLDSRAILGAVLECKPASDILAVTFGMPGTFDFEIGARLARETGLAHRALDVTRPADYDAEFRRRIVETDGLVDLRWRFLSDWDTLFAECPDVVYGFLGDSLSWRVDQRLYRRMLVARFPRLFALPVDRLRGLPLTAGRARRFLHGLGRSARKRIEALSLGLVPAWSRYRERLRVQRVRNLDWMRLMRDPGPLRTLCEGKLRRLAERGLLDPDAVWALWGEHSAATADHARPINFLVSLEYILEVFCDGAPSGTTTRVRRVPD